METRSIISLFFILQTINNGVNLIIAQKPQPSQQHFKCSNNGNFKSDALLKERDFVFDLLYKRFVNVRIKEYTGFDASPASEGVWTNALCPPNIKKEACAECIGNTIPYLKQNCPKQKEGVAWTVLPQLNCMVRYADYRIQAKLEMSNWAHFATPPNATAANAGELEKGLNNLADKLKASAAGGDNFRKYGSGSVTYGSGSTTLYGSMQCIPDINKDECIKCLSAATKEIYTCCSQKRTRGGTVLSAGCYFWYAHVNFLPKTL